MPLVDLMVFLKKKMNLCEIAAGIILVEEAGGIIEKINLKNYKSLKVFASTPAINNRFSKIFD